MQAKPVEIKEVSDLNKKRPPIGWEDEDSTHDHWMKAAKYAIEARKAAGLL